MSAKPRDARRSCDPPNVKELFYGSVTVGERGQIVIPAEARKRFALEPGDKLLVFRQPHLPGLVLARLEDMQEMLQGMQAWMNVVSQIHEEAMGQGQEPKPRPKKGGQRR